ncbi:transposase [Microcoleus sp.]|uniref:transposase n=1 Tax=unclassified Microcoleus TaxID=2642155 RepID=UPI0035944702
MKLEYYTCLTRTHASNEAKRAYMDNLPAHKVDSIKPMIEAVGASILCLSPYSPDFNPIELWWSQLKSLLRQFSPTSTKMVETIIAVAIDLINPKHLTNWFTNCCYCIS